MIFDEVLKYSEAKFLIYNNNRDAILLLGFYREI